MRSQAQRDALAALYGASGWSTAAMLGVSGSALAALVREGLVRTNRTWRDDVVDLGPVGYVLTAAGHDAANAEIAARALAARQAEPVDAGDVTDPSDAPRANAFRTEADAIAYVDALPLPRDYSHANIGQSEDGTWSITLHTIYGESVRMAYFSAAFDAGRTDTYGDQDTRAESARTVEQECGCVVTLHADGTDTRARCARHAARLALTEPTDGARYAVVYSAEDGSQSEGAPTTLAEASRIAGEMVYRLTGEPFAGFPVAVDTYPVRAADGTHHTVRVVDLDAELATDADDATARATAETFAVMHTAHGAKVVGRSPLDIARRTFGHDPMHGLTVTVGRGSMRGEWVVMVNGDAVTSLWEGVEQWTRESDTFEHRATADGARVGRFTYPDGTAAVLVVRDGRVTAWHHFRPAPTGWVDVVFVQDWDAEVGDNGAPEWGDRDAMAEYLTQWDYGAETDDAHTRDAAPWGSGDDTTDHVIGGLTYTLATNSRLRYASLNRRPLPAGNAL